MGTGWPVPAATGPARAVNKRLGLIDLTGTLVTGDALHCAGETARLILARGGDWLFALKANRPAQYAEIAAFFAGPANRMDGAHTTTDGHNGKRIELRRHVVGPDAGWMLSDRRHTDEAPMPVLAMLGMHGGAGGHPPKQNHSATPVLPVFGCNGRGPLCRCSAHPLADREQPALGAGVGFDGDRARNRRDHGPENLAILRKLALNGLRTARPDMSIRRERKRSGWSNEFTRSILGQMRQPWLGHFLPLT